jgi:ArsR family transcriptional regulator
MEMQCQQFFQLLSDDTRLRSLMLIQQEGELCVCELVHALGVIQPKVSRHLAILRDYGVVADRRSGQWIYYQIHPDLPDWARQVIDVAVNQDATRKPYANDLSSLSKMPGRPEEARCG